MEMNDYLELIKSVIPEFNEEHLKENFQNVGVDSFDLVTIRILLENYIDKTIPDNDWMSFRSFYDVIRYCSNSKKQPEFSGKSASPIVYKQKITIGMPQMSICGLSENWLFKSLGNAHWEMLCEGLNTNSKELKDDIGNRLYATFVRIRFQSSQPLYKYNENEEIKISGAINRYGNGMYFSDFELVTSQNTLLDANLMTSFSIRKSVGNEELVKSQPNVTNNLISRIEKIPDFGNEYRLIKKREQNAITLGDNVFTLDGNYVFQAEYNINPYYDSNGVGLLYFAAYPVINDICEARHFNTKKNARTRWEETYFSLSRDVMYYANCNLSDTVIYQLNHWEILQNDKLKISSSLFRKSDNQIMARLFSIKERRNDKSLQEIYL